MRGHSAGSGKSDTKQCLDRTCLACRAEFCQDQACASIACPARSLPLSEQRHYGQFVREGYIFHVPWADSYVNATNVPSLHLACKARLPRLLTRHIAKEKHSDCVFSQAAIVGWVHSCFLHIRLWQSRAWRAIVSDM
jgi:hypothetical protein